MATAVQIQNCKKIIHDEIDKEIDEYFDFANKNQIYGSFDEAAKSPEFLDFLFSRNYPYELYEYIVCKFDRSIKTCEETVKEGIRLRKEFDKGQRLKVRTRIAFNKTLLNATKNRLKKYLVE